MDCRNCPFKGRPKVRSEGNPDTCKYVLIGEAPAHDEIRLGRPFVGQTGRLLMAFMARAGIAREDCYICNALLCQLPKNKKGLAKAIRNCRPRLMEELDAINTGATIAVMGGIAKDSIFPGMKGGILKARGWKWWTRRAGVGAVWGRGPGRNVYLMVHPAFYLYNPNEAPMLVKDLMRLKRGRQVAPEVDYHVLYTKHQLRAFVNDMHRVPIEDRNFIAFDLECDQVDHQRDRILSMSMSIRPGDAYIIPDSLLYRDGKEFITTKWSKKKWAAFLKDPRYLTARYLKPDISTVMMIREMFALKGYRWVAHNCKFDMRFLRQYGVFNVHTEFDTIVAHYTLDERRGGHGLKALADDYYDTGDYEHGLYNYIPKKSGRYSKIPRDVLYGYNAMDTEVTLLLAYDLERELIKKDLYETPFMYPMMSAIPMLFEAEWVGVQIDWDELARIDKDVIMPELVIVAQEMRDICGNPNLNPLSSVRVNDIMYDQFKFPIISVRTRAAGKKIRARSSQAAVMDGWKQMWEDGKLHVTEQAWRFCERLRHYRHVRKMQGSYVRKWLAHRGLNDRVHTSYWLRGTVTGRLASKDPPLQTIPSKVQDKWGPLIANAHIARPGWKLVYADYSQAELMAIACEANDTFMLNAFLSGEDYHDVVSIAAYGENFTRDERQASKRLTFGWAYGGNVKEIATDALQFTQAVADRFAKEWNERFKGVIAWRKVMQAHMRKHGYVESIFGRRRRFILLSRANLGKAMRIAVNAPIQSAISDLNLVSAIRLYNIYKDTDYAVVIMLIHDSLVMEAREDKAPEVAATMTRVMLEVAAEYFTQIPFRADAKIGDRLGQLTA